MSDKSKIEWTDASWNPVTGCTEVSPGCDRCYAKTFAERWRGTPGHHFEAGFDVTLRPERLDQPLRWRKPRMVFVNSMSDLFHADVPTAFIGEVFATMALAERHTFQILTKRHSRMRNLMNDGAFRLFVQRCAVPLAAEHGLNTTWAERVTDPRAWPLDNIWLGVSVETQQWADIRIPALLETPAAVRWLSCEPLLGPVDLSMYVSARCKVCDGEGVVELVAFGGADVCPDCGGDGFINSISWVVCGGESGPGARPMELGWAQSLVDQCRAASVPVFVKQLGSRWGKRHHDIEAFPEALRVREYPAGAR